jgi:hypothetical protein
LHWKNLGVETTTMRVAFRIEPTVCLGKEVATLVEELHLFQRIADTVFSLI